MTVLDDPGRLLVASFTSLMAFEPASGRWDLVHEGRGKYFGMAALDDASLAVVSRPEGGRPDDLLVFGRRTADLQRTISLPSTDTHQIARAADRLFVADTGQGRVVSVPVADPEAPPHTVATFEVSDHVNSVRPSGSHVDLLLHKFGPSELVRVDRTTGEELLRIEGVGRNSHDLEPWGDRLVVCASALGGIIAVDPSTGAVAELWRGEETFTKGLAVVDDLAWFGASAPSTRLGRWTLPCELVGVDLSTGREVERHPVPHLGLVNAVAQIGQLDAARVPDRHA